MTGRFALVLLALVVALGPGRAEPPPRWIVVTAPAFRTAIEPLCAHRRAEGIDVRVVQTTDLLSAAEIRRGDAAHLRDHVQWLCRDGGECHVLLVGALSAEVAADAEASVLPPLAGTVGRMKGQPTDHGYSCPDAAGRPTVAVGRLPARTQDEAHHMVARILAFERDREPGAWRRRITVLAGVPAFNPLVDRLVEGLALARFERLHPAWSGRVIYQHPLSRFCLPDAELPARARRYVEEGQAILLYLGHSWPEGLYAPATRFLQREDFGQLRIAHGRGVFITFGCCGCQLGVGGQAGEGYGLAAFRNPHGPVAVIGSQGICFAAMCQLAADGLLESFRTEPPPRRLGQVWQRLTASLAEGPIDPITFRLLDAVDGDPGVPLATQRREHLEMFLLLGDPALRWPQLPADIDLEVEGAIAAGQAIRVRGTLPPRVAGGKVWLTLERPMTAPPADLLPLPAAPGPERDRVLLVNHERANDPVVARRELSAREARFDTQLTLPDNLPWPRLILRAYAVSDQGDATGVCPLTVATRNDD
jgi:hypothetical protein